MPAARVDGELVVDWLASGDAPWLRDLLLGTSAFAGRPFADLRAHWREVEVPPRAGDRWRHVLAVLRRIVLPPGPRATRLRAVVFAAAAGGANREQAFAAGAAATGTPVGDVQDALLADLGDQRRVRWPSDLDVDAVRRRTNGHFAQALLATATAAELTLHGASRAVLRTAWLHGAWFARTAGDAAGARLAWRPPPGDARAGRRLAAIVPVLAWTRRWQLRAECRWRGVRAPLVLSSLDALPVGAPIAPFDSRFEADVAAALARELVGWEVVREPAPVVLGEHFAFPDFGLLPRRDGGPPWWVELAGLRDARALPGKLALLAAEERYVLCVPAGIGPAAAQRVVVFGRRGRVGDVVAGVRRAIGLG